VKKNILLIPTTDNVIVNWNGVYKFLENKGHSIYIISDNKFITKQPLKQFIKIDAYILRLLQTEGLSLLEIVSLKLYTNTFAKYILKKYKIDVVIVSNDNPIVQNIFVNRAKKVGINTILHQAAGIFKKPVKPSTYNKLRIKLRMLLFNESSSNNIGNDVEMCLIQGKKWINYIDNGNYKIIGNEYYRELREKINTMSQNDIAKFKDTLQAEGKEIIVFFSQPFKELKMSSNENIRKLYGELKNLESSLLNSGKYIFIFKPHPQEFYYKEFNFKRVVEVIDLNLLVASSDVCVTIFSTMAIQSKVALKKTIGYLPKYFSDEVLNQMKPVFDATSDNVEGIFYLINNTLKSKEQEFDLVSDLSIDTKTIVKEIIEI
jgi:hypothetical protein